MSCNQFSNIRNSTLRRCKHQINIFLFWIQLTTCNKFMFYILSRLLGLLIPLITVILTILWWLIITFVINNFLQLIETFYYPTVVANPPNFSKFITRKRMHSLYNILHISWLFVNKSKGCEGRIVFQIVFVIKTMINTNVPFTPLKPNFNCP